MKKVPQRVGRPILYELRDEVSARFGAERLAYIFVQQFTVSQNIQ